MLVCLSCGLYWLFWEITIGLAWFTIWSRSELSSASISNYNFEGFLSTHSDSTTTIVPHPHFPTYYYHCPPPLTPSLSTHPSPTQFSSTPQSHMAKRPHSCHYLPSASSILSSWECPLTSATLKLYYSARQTLSPAVGCLCKFSFSCHKREGSCSLVSFCTQSF